MTTQIHAIYDALGNPVKLDIEPEQDTDILKMEPLMENIDPDAFLADKTYDTDRLINRLIPHGITPVIPKKNATERHDGKPIFSLSREPNSIEIFSIKSISFVLSQPTTVN